MQKINHDWLLIVAGGTGSRMGSDIPKQFLPLQGVPVIIHTIRQFIHVYRGINIMIAIHPSWENYLSSVLIDFPCERKVKSVHPGTNFDQSTETIFIVHGGASRFHSVMNGLNAIPGEEGVVAIHDAVRPFVSADVVKNAFGVAAVKGSAIPVIPSKNSVRIIEGK